MELSQLNDHELTKFYREKVGFIFQAFNLSPIYSTYENIEIILRIAGTGRKERHDRALYCLDLVGLSKWKNHRSNELSGGQQQRVAIARALANRPRLILADEPTGKLDTATSRDLLALFQDIVTREQVTVLIASHDPLVDGYSDYTLRLKDGMILSPDR